MVIGIDIGHNVNYDKGANGIRFEDNLNALVGNELIKKLEGTNAKVVNCTPSNANSLGDSLRRRCTTANNSGCDIFISIHHNAGGGTGAEALIYPGDTSNSLGATILKKLEEIGLRNRGVKNRNDLFVLSYTKMPAIIVECAFVDSNNDMRNYNHSKIASAIFSAICSHYGLNSGNVTAPKTYTVLKGDTLWGISRKFGTTVDKLTTKNGITNPSLIYPGQKLIIE